MFADLPAARLREVTSAIAHSIAGVLDHEMMLRLVEDLASLATGFKPGDRVKTLRGSARGVVIRTAADGRIVWRLDGGGELMALPEDLLPD